MNKRRLTVLLAPALCIAGTAALVGSTSASAAAATETAVRARPTSYYVCIPATDVPRPSSFPYNSPITTKTRSNSHLRRSVRDIQAILVNEGYAGPSGGMLAIDGTYGSATKFAVKNFQRGRHITVDGKVGPVTWRKLANNCWKFH